MPAPFQTHSEALIAFRQLSPKKTRVKGNQTGVIVPQKKEISGAYLNEFREWMALCQKLPTPWPHKILMELANTSRSRNDDGSESRRTEVLALMETPFSQHEDVLEQLLQWGMDPTMFIKKAHVTMLGYAVYARRLDDVKVLLRHCSPPKSRLLLESSMLPSHTPNRNSMVNSTLLHRVSERFSKAPHQPQQVLPIVDALLEHDPSAILCKTKNGRLPEDFATGPLRQEIKDRRLAYQAQLSQEDLLTHVHPDNNLRTTVRKM